MGNTRAFASLSLVLFVSAHSVFAHIVDDDPHDNYWEATSNHLTAISQQMPFIVQVGGCVAACWYLIAFMTASVIGLIIWNDRSDRRIWYLATLGMATAWVTSYAVTPLIGSGKNMLAIDRTWELAERQFAVFIGYYAASLISWSLGWLILAASRFFRNAEIRRLGICSLLVSVILLWIAHRFLYIAPLNQLWWA